MRILILADANSAHTIKWVKGLTRCGVEVGLWSLAAPNKGTYDDCSQVVIEHAGIPQKRVGILAKARYLTAVGSLKRFIKLFQPTILHAHFATSYGLLGSLVHFHPYIISVWGSDVYDFPKKGKIFEKILRYNLKQADVLLSTSHVMAEVTKQYTNKPIAITPFGIDLNMFCNTKQDQSTQILNKKPFTIGTVKTLEKKYGIDYLIEAFALFRKRYPVDQVQLYIVGGGSQEQQLKKLAQDRGIADCCSFVGPVSYKETPLYHRKLDIAVFLSVLDSESFGVSVIEASASERPVIVSDVGGLPEVTNHGETGIVVASRNVQAAANAMEKLYVDEVLRTQLGRNGRRRVEAYYNLDDNLAQMIAIYGQLLSVFTATQH